MAKINDVHSIIVPANIANVTAHTYTEIYGGSAGCTLTLNGVPNIIVAASSSISVKVRNFSGGTGCFFLGEDRNVTDGSTSL